MSRKEERAGPAARLHAPAAERNRGPILEVLRRVLPPRGSVLEIASGAGQHVAFFAASLPGLRWQPSERDPSTFPSIRAWVEHEGATNVEPPIVLDVCMDPWPVSTFDAIFSANLLHIAPWEACLGLVRGAGRHLVPGGLLLLYGPFKIGGRHTAPSNEAFDRDLRSRDPAWGVRDVDQVSAAAAPHGLVLEEPVPMPANNQTLVYRRT